MHALRRPTGARWTRLGTGLVAAALPVALAACSNAPSAAAGSTTTSSSPAGGRPTTTTTTVPATTSTVAATTSTTVAPTTTTAPPTMVPMQTPTGGEFLSPSGNVSCEVDFHRAGVTGVGCQTLTPPQSVRLTANGTVVTRCSGQQCLGNPGLFTPTLAYGQATGVGPYRCLSKITGVVCTANSKGFEIAKSGITLVSGT